MSEMSPLSVKRSKANAEAFEELLGVMRELRLKCPWDKKQTHRSLIPYLREETFEMIEAILKKEDALLKEELGDVLFQVVFHTQLATERKAFDMAALIRSLSRKMKRRHPHVFDPSHQTSLSLDEQWETLKRAEKPKNTPASRFHSIPEAMDPWLTAERVQLLAARDGFDWDSPEGIVEKIKEETLEFEKSLKTTNTMHQKEELGDLLFSVINLCRFLKWDSGKILHAANAKFRKRYDAMLKLSSKEKKPFRKLPLSLKEKYWQRVKSQTGHGTRSRE